MNKLEQLPKLLHRQSRSLDDRCHRVCIDGVVPRNRKRVRSVSHYDVFALTCNTESGFLECPNSMQMIDAWY